jgi:aminoglycoside 2'-N-acetyltransferase I
VTRAPPEVAPLPVQRLRSAELGAQQLAGLRALLDAAFGGEFTAHDWEHALGGVHFVVEAGARWIAHASVVERELRAGSRALRTGYVEAVATTPERQGEGIGSRVMAEASSYIRAVFELGALSTHRHGFYGRLGWLPWLGPTSVRTAQGCVPTPEDDGGILVLPTPGSADLERGAPLSCEWRAGDLW